jgi:hypothetical protein
MMLLNLKKAESLGINSIGQRPMKRKPTTDTALKGRNLDYALSGLKFVTYTSIRRTLPYAIAIQGFQPSFFIQRNV